MNAEVLNIKMHNWYKSTPSNILKGRIFYIFNQSTYLFTHLINIFKQILKRIQKTHSNTNNTPEKKKYPFPLLIRHARTRGRNGTIKNTRPHTQVGTGKRFGSPRELHSTALLSGAGRLMHNNRWKLEGYFRRETFIFSLMGANVICCNAMRVSSVLTLVFVFWKL